MIHFAAEAEKYRQEFVALLDQWIRIPSVYSDDTASPGMPFGSGVAQALEWFINQGREAGFATKAVDGYAAHVEYGSGKEYACAFGHCDVVPAGEGWSASVLPLRRAITSRRWLPSSFRCPLFFSLLFLARWRIASARV